jgi:hypothetical protein
MINGKKMINEKDVEELCNFAMDRREYNIKKIIIYVHCSVAIKKRFFPFQKE